MRTANMASPWLWQRMDGFACEFRARNHPPTSGDGSLFLSGFRRVRLLERLTDRRSYALAHIGNIDVIVQSPGKVFDQIGTIQEQQGEGRIDRGLIVDLPMT